jgi:hypothetical protein
MEHYEHTAERVGMLLGGLSLTERREVFSHFCGICGVVLAPHERGRCQIHSDERLTKLLAVVKAHLNFEGAPEAPCYDASSGVGRLRRTCCELACPRICKCQCHERRIMYFNDLRDKAQAAFYELFSNRLA